MCSKRRKWLLLLLPALLLLAVPIIFWVYDLFTGIHTPYRTRLDYNPNYPELGVEWVMHPVDNPGDWLPNGLDSADMNGDGINDYVTNYEYSGRTRVALHPGAGLSGDPWQAYNVSKYRI